MAFALKLILELELFFISRLMLHVGAVGLYTKVDVRDLAGLYTEVNGIQKRGWLLI